jgi:hypothetical protein
MNTFYRFNEAQRLLILNTCENFFRCTEQDPVKWVHRWDTHAMDLWHTYYPRFTARAGRKSGLYIVELDRAVKKALNGGVFFKQGDSSDKLFGAPTSPVVQRENQRRFKRYSQV